MLPETIFDGRSWTAGSAPTPAAPARPCRIYHLVPNLDATRWHLSCRSPGPFLRVTDTPVPSHEVAAVLRSWDFDPAIDDPWSIGPYRRRENNPEPKPCYADYLLAHHCGDWPRYAEESVYFLVTEGAPFVKIGRACDVLRRLDELQTGCPFRLTVAATLAGGPRTEVAVHAKFGRNRVRRDGEWFHLTAEVAAFVDQLATGDC